MPGDKPAQSNHWRDLHKRKNKDLLFAEDIGPRGTTLDVEIMDSGAITVTGDDGDKPMPWIGTGKRGGKKLGLNVTNSKTMETLTGTADYMTWRGWITLVVIRTTYPDRKTGKKLETDAIRISDQRPRRAASKSASTSSAPISAEEQAEIERIEREEQG